MASSLGPHQMRIFVNSIKKWAPSSWQLLRPIRHNSSNASFGGYYTRDPGPIFFNSEVQRLLKNMTGSNFDKVFRQRKLGERLSPPSYKFMSEEELQAARKEAEEKASHKLQMPPLIREREPINEVLSYDPEIQGFDKSKYVFTDITYGVSERKRWIVVRDPDGTLRQASWDERAKVSQIYFPQQGRHIAMPKMFEDENLQLCLDRGEYDFILDRACVQFEPDDPEYIRVSRKTYNAINDKQHYDKIHSTRHYGPMVLHLLLSDKADDLLIFLITHKDVQSAADLVRLYREVHPESSLLKDVESDSDLIQVYAKNYSLKRALVERAWEAYEEIQNQQKELESKIVRSQ
nr:EOG090X0AW0 [Eulimnadia texana]